MQLSAWPVRGAKAVIPVETNSQPGILLLQKTISSRCSSSGLASSTRFSKLAIGGKAMRTAAARNNDEDTFVRWGVAPGAALWPTVVRILFVVDGRINTSTCPVSFGLGYVLETLRDPSFAWWVRFSVKVVRRDLEPLDYPCDPTKYPDTNYTEDGNNQKLNFKFTDSDFSFDDWDQVWFFGDYPANADGDINSPGFYPLDDAELKLLAEWMDRGGGVFAAGDHWNLGASMCSRIPRVRTMRKWTHEQGVPTMDGDTRNQTLQPDPDPTQDTEGDTIPQPIELTYLQWTTSILARPPVTHPLLTTPTGVINTFPDHMHEGELFDDSNVQLDSPLNIPGYDQPEYPYEQPVINPGVGTAIAPGVELPRPRPSPHVVAYGRTTNWSPWLPSAGILARLESGVYLSTKNSAWWAHTTATAPESAALLSTPPGITGSAITSTDLRHPIQRCTRTCRRTTVILAFGFPDCNSGNR